MSKTGLIILFLCGITLVSNAQIPVPNLINYGKADYNGGRQNWDVDIDENGIKYFANTNGLLLNVYGEWNLLEIPGNVLIRSVLTQQDTVWVGGLEIGYFIKKDGAYVYKKERPTYETQIWNIESDDHNIYFQSEYEVIVYNRSEKSYSNIKFEARTWSILHWNKKIWTMLNNGEMGIIHGNGYEKVIESDILKNKEVRSLFIHRDKFFIVTFSGDVYCFNGIEISKIELPPELNSKRLFTGAEYDQTSFLLGSINSGVYRLGNDFEILDHINSKNGLIDDTILAMDVDDLGNIWLGLDYGISKVELQSPFRSVFKGAATYHIVDFNEEKYLATNKGLFREQSEGVYEFIENTAGQVWNLKVIDGDLYICHIRGLFKLNGNKAEFVADFGGFIDLERFGESNYFIFSSYHGVFLMKKVPDGFAYIENLELWGQPELHYDQKNLAIWGESVDGIIQEFRLSDDQSVQVIVHDEFKKVFQTPIGTFFSDRQQIYTYQNQNKTEPDHPLLKGITGNIQSLNISTNGNKVVYMKEDQLYADLILPDGTIHSYSDLFKSLGQDLIYENPYLDFEGPTLRMATERGVLTFDFEFGSTFKNYSNPVIRSISVLGGSKTEAEFTYPFPADGVSFSRSQRDLQFNFGINKSHYYLVEYRYRLVPDEKKWSEWSNNSSVIIPQLRGGKHVFELQARINGGEELTSEVNFTIQKYWYETQWILVPALIAFLAIILIIIFLVNRRTEKRLLKQARELKLQESHRTVQLKNEQLLQYVEIISHKNEFLNRIKAGLQKMRNSDAQRWVNLITNEVDNEKKEFLFHKLFSELHQDFIERISKTYPSLTSNDIRLLTFYRVNLQKDEIASLMNISPRSLDTSRYRLRKKLNLDHDTDLDKFIREF